MRFINIEKANELLICVGLEIGSWAQIHPANNKRSNQPQFWRKYRAPEHAHELYSFSQYVAGWLNEGIWKMFQVDNSTALDFAQEQTLSRILYQGGRQFTQWSDHPYLLEYSGSKCDDQEKDLMIADLIFWMLLWEQHAQLVSSSTTGADILSLHDGFVYFCSNDEARVETTPVEDFEKDKRGTPHWVLQILEANGST